MARKEQLKMSYAPKVSIVIPVYNAGDLLRIMMDSVLAQTERSLEVVLIDDGSNDGGKTARLLSEYAAVDGRVRVLRHENQGVVKTRDFGVGQAKGDWVYVVDQDDYLHPRLIEFALWACERHDLDFLRIMHEFGSIASGSRLASLDDFDSVDLSIVDNGTDDAGTIGDALNQIHIDAWSYFVKRELGVMFPLQEYSISRPFRLALASARWGVEHTPLYYYHGDIESSMIHRAVSPGEIDYIYCGWRNVYDVLDANATDEKGKTVKRMVCRGQIAKWLKVVFHMVKRLNRKNRFCVRMKVWGSFGRFVLDFIFRRRLTAGMIGIKHYVEYLFVALAFGVPAILLDRIRR